MITGFPPSPFAERPVRTALNLIGASLGFIAAIIVIVGATDNGANLATGIAANQMVAVGLLLAGTLAVLANERVGIALIVGGGATLAAGSLTVWNDFSGAKAGIPTVGKELIVAGIIGGVAMLVSVAGLKTPGNIILAIVGCLAGLIFAAAHWYIGLTRHTFLPIKAAAAFLVLGIVIAVTPFLGRIGVLAAVATAIPQVQSSVAFMRRGTGFGGFSRFGPAVAILMLFVAAIVLVLIARQPVPGATYIAVGPNPATYLGYPQNAVGQPGQPAIWAQTVPSYQMAGAGAGAATGDPWVQPGQEPAVTVLPTQVVQAAPAVVNVANPARWEADPYARFQKRYWDGTRWTEHVSSDGSSSVDPI